MKRLLRTALCLLLVIAMLPVPAMAADALTEDAVYQKMIALKEEYPEGTPWTNDNYYAWNGGIYSGGYGCAGFAFMLSDAAFGELPARKVTEGINLELVRVGDILRINDDTHSVILLEVHDDHVVIAEGNYNSSVHWGRTLTGEEVADADYVLTRYPEEQQEQEHTHTMTKTDAKAATCTAEGNNAYYTCSGCGKIFKDGAGTTETSVEAEKLAKLSHTYAESWTADAENHWHKCENCDAAAEKTAHTFEWVIDQEATAEADGIKHEACTVCGYKRNENTPHHVHRMTKTEAKESTCTEGGSNAYYTCALCQKVYKDEAGTTETTVEAEALPLADHTGGTATCTAQAVCEVCGKGYGDMASHDYNEAWTADADSHWHKCVNCDATSTKTAHVFEWVIDKEATAEETGLKHEACTTCGYKRSENTIIDIAVHEHTMVKTPSKDATCEEAGNIAYWSCETCGGIYADKDGSIETTLEKVTVEATGHAYDDGKVTTEPTATEDGVRTFTCENCGATRTEVIPALGEEEAPTEPTEPENTVDVIRIAGDNRCKTAFAAADKLKEVLGIEKFDAIILASGDNFADALAGSYLAAVKKAPILLYRKNTEAINSDYIAENLASGGTVYILGGTAAVPKTMADALEGVNVQRLAGDNRYETNLKILKAAGVEGDEILVATGMDFADCLAASATGLPILMVNSRLNNLTSGQKEFLEANSGKNITVIGGEAAVSKALLEKLEDYCYVERIQGARREETSLNVAKAFCGEASTVVIAYSRNFPDALCGGPLAYALKCPLLLVNKNNESYAAEYAADQTLTSAYVLGGTAALSDATVNKVFAN